MRSVGIKALKNRLSTYVRLATLGETVLVTDRDKVVAELGPPRADRPATITDAVLAEGARQGWLRPALASSSEPPPRLPVMRIAELLTELEESQEDR
jgi:antitoxin (DNA-binding transcriptional repressor) of toxin-antitoxin stability system